MGTKCEIEFDNNPSKVIYSGRTLHAVVNVTLANLTTIHSIYVKLIGEANANWQVRSGSNRRISKSYTGSEKYLDERINLVDVRSDEVQQQTLQPGTYHYPLEKQLPVALPTSFEGEDGYIRYDLHVVLVSYASLDEKFVFPFTVIKAIDLNADPRLREPVTVTQSKGFYWCCYKSPPLEITVRSPISGYVPGHTINLELTVINRSSQRISEFTVQLIRQITYYTYANSPRSKTVMVVMVEKRTRGCATNREDIILSNMRVPAVPPSDETTSNIIKVRYFCRVIGSVDCCHSDPVLMLPIVIGTYPFRDEPAPQTVITLHPSAPQVDESEMQPTEIPSPSAPMQFSNDEPPSYEEAMRCDKRADNDFLPKYPVFKQ